MPKDFDTKLHKNELKSDPIDDAGTGFSIRGSATANVPIVSQTPKRKPGGAGMTPRNTLNGHESTTPSTTNKKKRLPDQQPYIPPAKRQNQTGRRDQPERRVPQMLEKKDKGSAISLLDSDDLGTVSPHFSKKMKEKDPLTAFVDRVPAAAAQLKQSAERAPARKAQDELQRRATNPTTKTPAAVSKPLATPTLRPGAATISRPGTQNIPRPSAATTSRPGATKSGATKPGAKRGLMSQKNKKPLQDIALDVFHRGGRKAQGENCHFKIKQLNGDTEFTPWVGDVEHRDLRFSVHGIGSLCQHYETRVNIKLTSRYEVPVNGQFIDFTLADEGSFNRFCEIINTSRKIRDTNSLSIVENFFNKNIKDWLTQNNVDFVLDPPPTEEAKRQIESDAQYARKMADEQQSRPRETRSRAMKPPAADRTVISLPTDTIPDERPPVELLGKRPKRQSARISYVEKTPEKKVPQLPYPTVPWESALLYPFDGPKRANVDYGDLKRLEDEEFLNDNIINFYMRYIEANLQQSNPELHKQTHFFNTFFYERLSAKGENTEKRIDAVLKWTNRIDLFSKNYIVVPINENSHWYLALICNLQNLPRKLNGDQSGPVEDPAVDSDATIADAKSEPSVAVQETPGDPMDIDVPDDTIAVKDTQEKMSNMALEEPAESDEWPDPGENPDLDRKLKERNRTWSPDKKKPRTAPIPPDSPCIIILDSMSVSGGHAQTFKNIRAWLVREASVKRALTVQPNDISAVHGKAPSQNNWYDCGLFVLHYVEKFFQKPTQFVEAFLSSTRGKGNGLEWDEEAIKKRRVELFNLMLKLHDDYEQHEKDRKLKEAAKKADASKSAPATPSKPPSLSPPAAPPKAAPATSPVAPIDSAMVVEPARVDDEPMEASPASSVPKPAKKSLSPAPEPKKQDARIEGTPQPEPKIPDEIPESPPAPQAPPPSRSSTGNSVNLSGSDEDDKMGDTDEDDEEEEQDRPKSNAKTMMGNIMSMIHGGVSSLTGRKTPASKASSTVPRSPTKGANLAHPTDNKVTPSKSAQEKTKPASPKKLSEPESSEAVEPSLATTWGTVVDQPNPQPNVSKLSISVPTPAKTPSPPSAPVSPVDETPTQRRRSPRNTANSNPPIADASNSNSSVASPARTATRSSTANSAAATAETETPVKIGTRKLKRRRKTNNSQDDDENAAKKAKPIVIDLSLDDTPEKEKPSGDMSQEL